MIIYLERCCGERVGVWWDVSVVGMLHAYRYMVLGREKSRNEYQYLPLQNACNGKVFSETMIQALLG